MSDTHTQVASELLDEAPNRYQLVLDVAHTGKRLLDEQRERRKNDPFALDHYDYDDKVIYQSLIMKASEIDLGDGLIG